MKKLLCMVLAICLCGSMLGGCAGEPSSAQPQSGSAAAPSSDCLLYTSDAADD